MRFLIVDESGEFRRELAQMLRARWPEAQTDEWDPDGAETPRRSRRRAYTGALDLFPGEDASAGWRKYPNKTPPVVLSADHATHAAVA